MGYTIDDSMVRVDIFSGYEWYTTVAIKWDRWELCDEDGNYESINDTFKRCLKKAVGDRYKGMLAVCLEPYHEHSYPLIIRI